MLRDNFVGSNLFMPKVQMETVVLPDDTKHLILDTIDNYRKFKVACKDVGLLFM